MATNASALKKTAKRLAQAKSIKAAQDRIAEMSPVQRKAALRIVAAKRKKAEEKR